MSDLILEDVSRVYEGRAVVDRVSLSIAANAVTVLLGGSGAGKSTLLRLLAGLEPLDHGVIRFGERVLSSRAQTVPAEHRKIGLIFQDFALFPHLNARDNVAFGLAHLERTAARDLASDWLSRMGLSHRMEAYPHELSGGEQQRVSVARALAPQPVAILMDEPFSGLDPDLRASLRATVMDSVRQAGIPALMITHDAREAMLVADHLALMRGGRLVQQGTPAEIYNAPLDLNAARALGPVNMFEAEIGEDGQASTPFGAVSAHGFQPGDRVVVGIREEALILSETGERARVSHIANLGRACRIRLSAGRDDAFAECSTTDCPGIGVEVGVSIDPGGAFVFAAES